MRSVRAAALPVSALFATLSATLLAATLGPAPAAAQAKTVFVDRGSITCVMDFVKVYQAVERDPVPIALDLCPNPGVSAGALLNLTQRAAPTAITGGAPVTRAITLSKEQLACLADPGVRRMILGVGTNRIIAFPLDPCSL